MHSNRDRNRSMVAFGEGRGCDTEKQKEGGYWVMVMFITLTEVMVSCKVGQSVRLYFSAIAQRKSVEFCKQSGEKDYEMHC